MTERPMLFNGDMVRAILSGRKTQTRRPMKVQPTCEWSPHQYGEIHRMRDGEFVMRNGSPVVAGWGVVNSDGDEGYCCPFGKPGDRLWVRESFQPLFGSGVDEGNWKYKTDYATGKGYYVNYPSTDGVTEYYDCNSDTAFCTNIKPSIHMPRWACRIVLEITDVRVQRVQEIGAIDALSEGIKPLWEAGTDVDIEGDLWPAGERKAIKMFSGLWDSCYGKTEFAWKKDPWVWALTFKRVEGDK